MNNKEFTLIIFSICFGFACFIWGVMWMEMAKDLGEKVDVLEQEIIEYKWQLDQVDQMICIGDDYG